MAQKLAPAEKIAQIYLQHLQLFASLQPKSHLHHRHRNPEHNQHICSIVTNQRVIFTIVNIINTFVALLPIVPRALTQPSAQELSLGRLSHQGTGRLTLILFLLLLLLMLLLLISLLLFIVLF